MPSNILLLNKTHYICTCTFATVTLFFLFLFRQFYFLYCFKLIVLLFLSFQVRKFDHLYVFNIWWKKNEMILIEVFPLFLFLLYKIYDHFFETFFIMNFVMWWIGTFREGAKKCLFMISLEGHLQLINFSLFILNNLFFLKKKVKIYMTLWSLIHQKIISWGFRFTIFIWIW